MIYSEMAFTEEVEKFGFLFLWSQGDVISDSIELSLTNLIFNPSNNVLRKWEMVVCTVELTDDYIVKSFYAKPIADYSSLELNAPFDKRIAKIAHIATSTL